MMTSSSLSGETEQINMALQLMCNSDFREILYRAKAPAHRIMNERLSNLKPFYLEAKVIQWHDS